MLFLIRILDRSILPAVSRLIGDPGVVLRAVAGVRVGKRKCDALDGAFTLLLLGVRPRFLASVAVCLAPSPVRLVANYGNLSDVHAQPSLEISRPAPSKSLMIMW